MPFKTIAIATAEYYNMDLMICIEYDDIDTQDKFLKVVVHREYDDEIVNIFNYAMIPDDVKVIYQYCRNNSYIQKNQNSFDIYGKKIHRQEAKHQRLLSRDQDPIGDIVTKIDEENSFDNIKDTEKAYYASVSATIQNKK